MEKLPECLIKLFVCHNDYVQAALHRGAHVRDKPLTQILKHIPLLHLQRVSFKKK